MMQYCSFIVRVHSSNVFFVNFHKMGLFSGKCLSTARLDGKTAIVTGANTGIGKETIKDFYERGGRVIAACRNTLKANEAVNSIKEECAYQRNLGELVVAELDLSSLKSIKKFAAAILKNEKQIDILVNNAGVMACPESTTQDGFEMHFGTNHLGHFYLTMLLLPKIIQSAPARIVTVSSLIHSSGKLDLDDLHWKKRKYNPMDAYAQSKLANVLFSNELARKLQEANITNVTTYSLHPGVIKTDIVRHFDEVYFKGLGWIWQNFIGWLLKTPLQGAQTTIYCAVDEKCANETGLYYADCAVTKPGELTKNVQEAERLWKKSLELVGLGQNYNPFKLAKT